MSEDEEVSCDTHGNTRATFVCCHLKDGHDLGFHCSSDEDDPWPDAWCSECEAVLERDGEWTEENSPDLTLLCTGCYEIARRNNDGSPPSEPPRLPSLAAEGHAQLLSQAQDWCDRQQAAVIRRFPFHEKENWFYDADVRVLRFYDADGGSTILADVVIAGSLSTRTNSWAWVWGNDQYDEAAQRAVEPVRELGEARGVTRLSEPYWAATLDEAWEVAQIAAFALKADAVYRTPSEHLFRFMLLRRFRLAD